MNTNNIIHASVFGLILASIALLSAVKVSAAFFPIAAAAAGYLTVLALFAMASGDYRRASRTY
jgi:hypothetical protein